MPGRTGAGREQTSAGSALRPARRPGAGFWIVGFAFATTMAFSSVPAPLYVLYQHRDHFGPLLTSVIFAAYPVGTLVSLVLAGHLSDWLGRRTMMLAAITVNLAAAAVFLLWPAVPGLLIARVLVGGSIGMANATATAFLSELDTAARPGGGRGRAEAVATAANLGGIGVGPLLSGLLAQYAPGPLVLPYLVSAALLLAAATGLVTVSETVTPPDPRPRYRPQRIAVPASGRGLFLAAGLAAASGFALFGLFNSLTPGFIAATLHDSSHALAGIVAFTVFGAAALTQLALGRVRLAPQLAYGLAAMAAGLAAIAAAVWLPSLPLLLAGAAVAGTGIGATVKGATSVVLSIAPATARGESLAGLFVAAYTGLAVPVVGLGLATQLLPVPDAVACFAMVLLAAMAVASLRLLRPGGLAVPRAAV